MGRRLMDNETSAGFDGAKVSSRAMRAIVTWVEALNGSVSLETALKDLAEGLGAEAGVIVRTHAHDERAACIASFDQLRTSQVRPLKRSFAASYFGRLFGKARTGTIWQSSAFPEDPSGDPSLGDWQAARHMKEFVTLVLSNIPQTRDQVELHFRERLSPEAENTIALLLPEMVRAWASRRVGLVTRSIINHRNTDPAGFRADRRVNILGPNNPMRLSRAEFRVCLLLSSGQMVNAVAQELQLTDSTVRTHLRNIYAKTDSSSLAELVFRLVDGQSAPSVPNIRFA